MVLHHRELYADLNDPVALLRGQAGTTGLSRYWAYSGNADAAQLDGEQVAAYTALMAASQPLVAEEILAAYRIGRHRCLLDLGGGDGSFLRAAATQAPDLRLMLFDLPPVAEQARVRLAVAGLAGRSVAVGGDFLTDPLPSGADVVSLVRVIHDHDDPAALDILRAARRALPPGGTLLLAEPMAGTFGAEPIGDAYFGFYLMAMGRGRTRTQAELFALLDAAGFVEIRRMPTHTPLLVSVIVAKASQDTAHL
jgi:demethylspheroidene O-methyltransferase